MQTAKISKRIEIASNIAIIVAVLLLGWGAIRSYFPAHSSSGMEQLATGTPFRLTDTANPQKGPTVVLALQRNCSFCSASGPFYRRLADAAKRESVRLIAVLPQTHDEGRDYLASMGVEVEDVRQQSLSSIGVTATPTLVLLKPNGRVERAWVGRLRPERESEVLKSIGTQN